MIRKMPIFSSSESMVSMRYGIPRFPWLKVAAAFAALGLHAVVLAMVLSSPVVQVAPGQPEALDVQFVELAPANPAPPAAADSQAQAVPDPVPVPQPVPEAEPKPRPIHKTRSAPPARTRTAPVREVRPVHAASPSLDAASAASATRSDAARGRPQAADPDRPRVVGRVDYLGKQPAPVYPRLSERRGEQGRVVLRVLISPQGTVADVKIQHSSGYARLDEAAVQAVRQARFRPYTENGIAYPARVDIPFDFVL